LGKYLEEKYKLGFYVVDEERGHLDGIRLS
jgi:hypothetical protein